MELTNSQYEQLMNYYYQQQMKSKHELEEKTKQVRQNIPEYIQLEKQIYQLSVDYAKARLSHTQIAQNLQEQIHSITGQKEKLLRDHGYPPDYLQPVYRCPDCKDTGYIGDKKCHCFEKQIIHFLYERSNLREILARENFGQFDLLVYPDDYIEETTGQTPRDNMKKILNTVRDFISHFDNTFANLLLYGNTGVGKTFLTNCIAKELLDSSHTVVYLTSLQLFDILETYKFDRDLSYSEKDAKISYLLDSELLIIDDLGTELNNSFTSSQLYRCIDTRLNHHRSTIISTNLSFDDLREQYSERIFSRLTSNYTLLKLTGDDIRLKKAIQQ